MYSSNVSNGTRVPTKTGVPLMISGSLCTTGSLIVAIFSVGLSAEYTRDEAGA